MLPAKFSNSPAHAMPDPKIEMVSVDDLRPYANNARKHSKKQIAQIAESIRRFGFTNPVLISDTGLPPEKWSSLK